MARVAWGGPVYKAADLFRDRVMVDGKSFLWPKQEVWTDENITAVFEALLTQKPEGTASFLATLEKQLANLSDDAVRLAADVYAFYWLFPRDAAVSAAKKIQGVQQIASWRGMATVMPAESQAMLDEALDEGIGLPGQYYLLHQWEYLRFFLAFVRAIRRGAADPFESESCRQLVYRVAEEEGIKSHGRHVLLYLMFPDDFERTATTSQKKLIIDGFSETAGDQKDLDLALRMIRNHLIDSTGAPNLDFYDEPIRTTWDPEFKAGSEPAPEAVSAGRIEEVRQVLEGFYPDPVVRQACIEHLADSIAEADQRSNGGWSVRFNSQVVRLSVSQAESMSLQDGRLNLTIDQTQLTGEQLQQLVDAGVEPNIHTRAIDRESRYTITLDNVLTALSVARPLNLDLVRYAAGRVQSRTAFFGSHEPAVVDYLNQELGLNLRQPNFLVSPLVTPRYWKISPGASGSIWSEFRAHGMAAVQWAEVGNLASLSAGTKQQFRSQLAEVPDIASKGANGITYASNQLWFFAKEMKPGDGIVAYGQSSILGWGTITGTYDHEPSMTIAPHQRAVTWASAETRPLTGLPLALAKKLQQNLTILELTEVEFKEATVSPIILPPKPIKELEAATFMDTGELEDLIDLLHDKKQLILEGPPGSGKTWLADKLSRYLTSNQFDGDPDERVELVQFHQSYGYEDFVQGIRPITDADGKLTYRVVPGIFTRFCRTAASNPDKPFVLIIDEINRGNLSRIFGELLLLLEYRDKRVRLPYGSEGSSETEAFLSIPPNLYVIGTMNSTDRSLALIDYALRRRFYFHRLLPVASGQAPVLTRWLAQQESIGPVVAARIAGLFIALNNRIGQHLTPDFQIGHSYFMRPDIGTEAGLSRVWNWAVWPLLEEYFHGSRSGDQTLDGFRLEALLPSIPSLPVTNVDESGFA